VVTELLDSGSGMTVNIQTNGLFIKAINKSITLLKQKETKAAYV